MEREKLRSTRYLAEEKVGPKAAETWDCLLALLQGRGEREFGRLARAKKGNAIVIPHLFPFFFSHTHTLSLHLLFTLASGHLCSASVSKLRRSMA